MVEYLRGQREPLPNRRRVTAYSANIAGGPTVHLHVGEYADGRVGEIFLTQSRIGSFARGMVTSFAVAVSYALQYGAPLDAIIQQYKYTHFEPSGFVDGEAVAGLKEARSVVDWVAQVLEREYLHKGGE